MENNELGRYSGKFPQTASQRIWGQN